MDIVELGTEAPSFSEPADCTIDSVLCTEQLALRPSRPASYKEESQALLGLMQELKVAPQNILQVLVNTVLDLCHGHSAGISLLEDERAEQLSPQGNQFRWHAVAGEWASMAWSTTLRRDSSPCGTVVDRNSTLLFANPHRHFTQLEGVQPLPVEALLAPFHVDGLPVGTVWVVAHDAERKFDGEAQRLLESLATFAATAYQVRLQLTALQRQGDDLRTLNAAVAASQAEAIAANDAKSKFLQTMSHELRTPLNAIGGHVQLLEMSVYGPVNDEQRLALGRVKRNQQHLLGLINSVLDFSTIEAHRIEYRITVFPLGEALAELTPMIDPQIQAKSIDYEIRDGLRFPMVAADREKVQQVLLNLLSNAIKFTAIGGKVWIEASPVDAEGQVAIHVVDTGRGIPPAMFETIFMPFTQLDAGLSRAHEGTGLGLSISRELARGMGGDIKVRSEVGKGSYFTLYLTAATELAAEE